MINTLTATTELQRFSPCAEMQASKSSPTIFQIFNEMSLIESSTSVNRSL